jgi:hypothetical protein
MTYKEILTNVTSGRFILTMTGAVSFFIIVNSLCSMLIQKSNEIKLTDLMSILSPVLVILSNIFTFYFVKSNLQNESTPNNSSNGDNINGRQTGISSTK